MSLTVRYATIDDLDDLTPLFDGYRQFYGQAPDLARAREFIGERLRLRESVILVAAWSSGGLVGFVQMYPAFSSIGTQRSFILNDLFVAPEARRKGVAQSLMARAAQAGRALGAASLSLSTARDNRAAQALYQALGWELDQAFCEYSLAL